MRIGHHQLTNCLIAAPMAGITDRPFRTLCHAMGAGMAVSEMLSSNPEVWRTDKSRLRMVHSDEPGIRSVQIAGCDPDDMAAAARINVASGAQIIDINMGCPAKKICNVMAGSALLKDEPLVGRILEAVVNAVPDTPVTLKIRTGWDKANRNAPEILKIAENAGIRALAIHGRTRCQQYTGEAEYETIRAVKAEARIPIIANGDITTPEKAKHVLEQSQADALMIGRAAQGRPWLFREIEHYLKTGEKLAHPTVTEIHQILLAHLEDLYCFYGLETGMRVARKHIAWYTKGLVGSAAFRHHMNRLESVETQRQSVDDFFSGLAAEHEHLPYLASELPETAAAPQQE